MVMDRESASIAVAFTLVFAIVMIGFVYIAVIMPVVGQTIIIHNSVTQSGQIPLTQAHQNSILITLTAIQDAPVIIMILLGFWAVIEAKSTKNNLV